MHPKSMVAISVRLAAPLLALTLTWIDARAAYSDLMASCDARVAGQAALDEIEERIQAEPIEVFVPALVLLQNGRRDEAVFWYYAALLRLPQQTLVENGDRGQVFMTFQMTIGPAINTYANQDVAKLIATIDRVVEWDARTPNRFVDPIKAARLDAKRDAIYTGVEAFKRKLRSDREAIERNAREAMPRMEAVYGRNVQCREGAARAPAPVTSPVARDGDPGVDAGR